MTREEWLNKAITKLGDGLFKTAGYKVPHVRVSVGFPFGGRGVKAIGEHWSPDASIDKKGSIFISPIKDDAVEVLAILVHEMCHAAVGNKEGHGVVFKKCALAVGLEGKMRSTNAGPELVPKLKGLVKDLGKYPHSELRPSKGPTKKQKTRMLKMECGACNYIVRGALTSILTHGPVICPCNDEPMLFDMPEED